MATDVPQMAYRAVITRVLEVNPEISQRQQELNQESKRVSVKRERRTKAKAERRQDKHNQELLREARQYMAKQDITPLTHNPFVRLVHHDESTKEG